MNKSSIGTYKPRYELLGRAIEYVTAPPVRAIGRLNALYRANSSFAEKKGIEFRERLGRGETLYLMGIGPSGHNSAAALVKVSPDNGLEVLCNNEEERYTAIKNDGQFPASSLDEIGERLASLQLRGEDIFAVVASWDYVKGISTCLRTAVEEFPGGLNLIRKKASPHMNFWHFIDAYRAPKRLGRYFHSRSRVPVIGMRHHDNHAFYPYAMSPFAGSDDPSIIIVMDGFGDDGAISQYIARGNSVELYRRFPGIIDSQGLLYAVISSTQGGWEPLSSEGRYMGASAWGDTSRLTNPYYKQLRQILYFGSEGRVFVNRSMINYHKGGQYKPYNSRLTEILGKPIPPDKIWNPDMVLRVEDIEHAEITQERVDKAAALQMIYEDALFHMVGHLIRITGSKQLILSGGTALNCVANMKLLQHFDSDYYRRTYKRSNTCLHLWVPPNPSDTGTAMGAAYTFALRNGASPGKPMKHAFICGNPPAQGSVERALLSSEETGVLELGNIKDKNVLGEIADLCACIVSSDGFLGIYQGSGETGPRALGHRTIMANPCNPATLENLNKHVKFRELIRPLAPMMTLEEAKKYFYLAPGASDDEYNAYNYMILTAIAKEEAYKKIPAVIHKDGTSRLQIVRKETDPFSYAILVSMHKYLGVSLAVNTSLNVGTPIVHSPEQALNALHRSKGMSGIIMIEESGKTFLAWHTKVSPPKDGGKRLGELIARWTDTNKPGIAIRDLKTKNKTFA